MRNNMNMMLLLVALFFVLKHCGTTVFANKTELHIIGYLPFTGDGWPAGNEMRIAIDMAVESINKREDILGAYQLKMHYYNTQCDYAHGMDGYVRSVTEEPTKIMIFGAGCSLVTEFPAYASKLKGLLQVSSSSGVAGLSNKKLFPYFFRTTISANHQFIGKTALIDEFHWKRLVIIHDTKNPGVINSLLFFMKKYKTNMIASLTIEHGTGQNTFQDMQRFKALDARVFFIGLWTDTLVELFCSAYKLDMYGPKYVWIVQEWYPPDWWQHSYSYSHMDCTGQQILQVANHMFSVAGLRINPYTEEGITNYTSQSFLEEYRKRSEHLENKIAEKYSAMTFDAIWVLALTLDAASKDEKLKVMGGVESFEYGNLKMAERMRELMLNLSFVSISAGLFQFDQNGDPDGFLSILQYESDLQTKGDWQFIGMYNKRKEEFTWQAPIQWDGHWPPKDGAIERHETVYPSITSYVIFTVLASLGILATFGIITFNQKYQNVKVIKMSSPRINSLILVGCSLAYLSVIVQQTSEQQNGVVYCKTKMCLLLLGYSIGFGGLLGKTWRVYKIFTNVRLNKKPIKDRDLLIFVLFVVCFNASIVIVWELVDPLKMELVEIKRVEEEDIKTIYSYESCTCKMKFVFTGILLLVQAFMLLFASFLAYQARKVKVATMNDSNAIGICVYNVLILGVIGSGVNFLLENQVELLYDISSVVVICSTLVIKCLIFVPKIVDFVKGNNAVATVVNQNTKQATAGTATGTVQHTTGKNVVAESEI